jgi:hypothetical protein
LGSGDCKAVGCRCGEAHSVRGAYARFLPFFARTEPVKKGSSGSIPADVGGKADVPSAFSTSRVSIGDRGYLLIFGPRPAGNRPEAKLGAMGTYFQKPFQRDHQRPRQ